MKPEHWKLIKHFKPSEFDSPDLDGSGAQMDMAFVLKLDALRKACGFPLVVNSGYRTKAHNRKAGGKSKSAHLSGHAADLKVRTSQRRFIVVREALLLGFTRIGIGKTFVHVDDAPGLPQRVIWLY